MNQFFYNSDNKVVPGKQVSFPGNDPAAVRKSVYGYRRQNIQMQSSHQQVVRVAELYRIVQGDYLCEVLRYAH